MDGWTDAWLDGWEWKWSTKPELIINWPVQEYLRQEFKIKTRKNNSPLPPSFSRPKYDNFSDAKLRFDVELGKLTSKLVCSTISLETLMMKMKLLWFYNITFYSESKGNIKHLFVKFTVSTSVLNLSFHGLGLNVSEFKFNYNF